MPQIINTNIASLTAQRNLDRSQSANETALNRLSSGLRINSAKDDAAGLAISTRFESQTKGLAVAIRNAGDGISLAQTAEGALGSMTDSLQRIRELAVQSANATNSSSDREALQAEAAQLIDEINRVSEETNFNGQKLLNGDFAGAFQVGANTGERISFDLSSVTTSSLGVSEQAGVSAVGTDEALGNGDLNINGRDIRASSSQDDTLSYKNASASSIAKAAAINDAMDETGVKAVVDENVVGGSSMTAQDASGTLTINGVSINVETTSDATSTRSAVATAINAVADETGVMAVDSETDELGVTLVADDGRNITLDYSGTLTAQNTGLAETSSGSKAQVSANVDSIAPSSALDFSNKEGASVTFGLDITQANLDELNFSNADTANTTAQGETSFTVETDQGSYSVILDQNYTGDTDATADDSASYLDMVDDINAQISGSGFTAGVNADGKLEFTQDTAGQGYIRLSNGAEGYTGDATTATITANNDSTGAFALPAGGTIDFSVTDGTGNTSAISISAAMADLDALVTELNIDLVAGDADVGARNNNGKLEFYNATNATGAELTGAASFEINGFDNSTTNITDAQVNDMFGFQLASLTDNTSVGSSNDIAAAPYGVTNTAGLDADDDAAFGNNEAQSVFGEAVNQDGSTLNVNNIVAQGRDDSVKFDVTSTDRDGGVYVNTVTLDQSVADLDGLVNAINDSLSADPSATVSAFNNDGKLAFQTVSDFEGGISVGNFRDGGDQSEAVLGSQTISNSDLDNLFGFSITSADSAVAVGSGVEGSVDLNAPGQTKLSLTESNAGTASEISLLASDISTAGTVATGLLVVTLGDRSVAIDASDATGLAGTNGFANGTDAINTGVDFFNDALKGTELEGRVEMVSDGTTISIRSTENNGEQLSLTSGSSAATAALRQADLEGANSVNAVFTSLDLDAKPSGALQADNVDAAVNNRNATNTGSAATSKNNELEISIGGASETVSVATGDYTSSEDLAAAINTAISGNSNLNGNVQAFVEDGGISIRQLDTDATSTLTVGGNGAASMLGTQTAVGASAGAIDSASSEVEGDGDGKIGGEDTFEGGFTLLAVGVTSSIEIQGGNDTGNGSLDNSGLSAGTFEKGVASFTSADRAAAVDVTRGAGIAGSVDASGGVDVVGATTDGTTATLTGIASDFTGNTDFSGNSGDDNVSFDLSYTDGSGNTNTVTVALTTAISDVNGLVDDINDELLPSGIGITAQVNSDGDGVEFVASSGDGAGTVSIGNVNADYGGTASALSAGAVDAVLGLNASAPGGVSSDAQSGGVATITMGQKSSGTYDYSAQNLQVDITRDATTVNLTLNTDISDIDELVTELNSQLAADGTVNASFRNNDGAVELVSTTGAGNGIEEVSDDDLVLDFTDPGSTAETDAASRALWGMAGADLSAIVADTSGTTTTDVYVKAGATAATTSNIAGSNAIEENNTLTWSVDGGESGTIELTAGNYTTDEAVDAINNQIANAEEGDAAFNLKGSTAFNEDGKVVIRSDNTNNSGAISAIGGDGAEAFGLNATLGTEVDKVSGVNTLDSGDLVLNNVQIGASKATYDTASYDGAATSDKRASGIAIAEAINRETDATGVSANVNATQTVGGDGTSATAYGANDTGNIQINGVEIGDITLSGDRESDRRLAVSMINDKAGQTGVTAIDNGVSISLEAADGRNLSVAIDNKSAANSGTGDDKGIGFGAAIGLDASVDGIGEADFSADSKTADEVYETSYSTVTLESADVIDVKGGVNGNKAIEELGLEQGTFGGAEGGTFLKDVDLSTVDGANAAIEAIDNALGTVASIRADLGALQNRFESTTANLAITAENLTAANSRIRDADFAAETAELSRTQVLQQAGISILAQANQRPQQVLSLLG